MVLYLDGGIVSLEPLHIPLNPFPLPLSCTPSTTTSRRSIPLDEPPLALLAGRLVSGSSLFRLGTGCSIQSSSLCDPGLLLALSPLLGLVEGAQEVLLRQEGQCGGEKRLRRGVPLSDPSSGSSSSCSWFVSAWPSSSSSSSRSMGSSMATATSSSWTGARVAILVSLVGGEGGALYSQVPDEF